MCVYNSLRKLKMFNERSDLVGSLYYRFLGHMCIVLNILPYTVINFWTFLQCLVGQKNSVRYICALLSQNIWEYEILESACWCQGKEVSGTHK